MENYSRTSLESEIVTWASGGSDPVIYVAPEHLEKAQLILKDFPNVLCMSTTAEGGKFFVKVDTMVEYL